ncbi:MAG TPA: hypothetical protein VKA06_05675 [Spirochaetia bacterium]|nr:hypothetical protein [Spirochaetia bacterium]
MIIPRKRFVVLLIILVAATVGPHVASAQNPEHERAAARFGALQMVLRALEQAGGSVDGQDELIYHLFYARRAADLNLSEGQGITYGTTARLDGQIISEQELTIARLASSSDALDVWGYNLNSDGPTFYLELALNQYGIPVEVRYQDPFSFIGEPVRFETEFSREFDGMVENEGLQATLDRVESASERVMAEFTSALFLDPERLNSETVAVGAGSFHAIQLRSTQAQGSVDLWYNGQVPGAILRYRLVSSDETLQVDGELIEISDGHAEILQDAELVVQSENPPAPDLPENIESSPSSPVVTQLYYYGEASLAAAETDFFEITLPAGSRTAIGVFAFMGEVELVVFGADAEFEDAVHQESGTDITFEVAVSPEERTVHFTISADEPAAYELYLDGPEEY